MDINFSAIKAIQERRSVRTYEERPIEEAHINSIVEFMAKLDNPYSLRDIETKLIDRKTSDSPEKLGTYGVIKGASVFLGLSTPFDAESILMAGYEFETLILYITSLGLGTVWLGGTFKQKDFLSAMNFNPRNIMPAVSPVGYAAKKRFTEKVMRKFAKSDSRKPWTDLFFHNDFNLPLNAIQAGEYAQVLEMVRIAPSATNTQPWRILQTDKYYHIFGAFEPTLGKLETTMRYLDMGIAMCHFELTANELNLKGKFTRDIDPDTLTYPSNYTYITSWEKLS